MLAIQKNKDIIQQIRRVVSRAQHVHQVKNQLIQLISEVFYLNSQFSQTITQQMAKLEQFIVKNSLYYQKTDHIINLAKIYRDFAVEIQRNSKISLISIQNIKQQQIGKLQEKLKNKCEVCTGQFQKYIQHEVVYNQKFIIYNANCNELNQTITQYKSYKNPISFYRKIVTNQYLSTLDKQYQRCSTNESEMATCCQMIDQQRANLNENIKDVNECYFLFVHSYLDFIEKNIRCIVYPKNETKLQKKELNLRPSVDEKDIVEEHQIRELQRLQNLYKSQNGGQSSLNNPFFEQFSQLFRKSVNQSEISSDYKFFSDRCSSFRSKKLKISEETFKLHNYLFSELKLQKESYNEYEKSYKLIWRSIFVNNGFQSYKKKFIKYFGSNFGELLQLCLSSLERSKKSLERICKNMQQGQQKMKKILQNKRQAISAFEKRSQIILQDHLKDKDKVFSKQILNPEELNRFKASLSESFNQLKKVFMQLQQSEREEDKRYFAYLSSLYETIMRQTSNRKLTKLLEQQKSRIGILNSISIDRQTLSILKEDTRYGNLLNQCPKPNLYSTFVSQINRKEFQQTIILLKKKQSGLKNMIKPKSSCCGVKSQVIKQKVYSQHSCELRDQKEKYKGILNISELGIIFQESSWNPFSQDLKLIVPQSDIKTFDIKQIQQRQVVEIETAFGSLFFESKENGQILKNIDNNLNFRLIVEVSERGTKKIDSSSFLKINNTSTQLKKSFEKTVNTNQLSRVLNNVNSRVLQTQKVNVKPKTIQSQVKDLLNKWKDAQFLGAQKFTKVERKNAQIRDMRRDYYYNHGYNKYYLKQRRQYKIIQKDLVLKYDWKISFPESPMLHSFKHHQEISIENGKDLKIRIIAGNHGNQQLYIKNIFCKQIEEMNKLICQLIILTLEKDAVIINEQEQNERRSLDSCNIVVDDINLPQRDLQKSQSYLKHSRTEKCLNSSRAKGIV